MSGYLDQGPVTQRGAQDTARESPYLPGTGWVVTFAPDDLNLSQENTEVYQIDLDGPVGASAKILKNRRPWNTVNQGFRNSWDPAQPMLLSPYDTVQFFWSTAFTGPPYDPVTNVQPQVTMWLRIPA